MESLLDRGEYRRFMFYRAAKYLADLVAFALSTSLAFALRFDGNIPSVHFPSMILAMGVWTASQSGTFIVFKVYKCPWRLTSVNDAVRVVFACMTGSLLGGTVVLLRFGPYGVPRSVYVLNCLVACVLALGCRLLFRLAMSAELTIRGNEDVRIVVYGAGAAAQALLREVDQNRSLSYRIVGLVDDSPQKKGSTLLGRPVLGSGEDLVALVRKHRIQKVLIAIPSASGPQMLHIFNHALAAGVPYQTVPSLGELILGSDLGRQIRDVAVEDLLGRKPVQLEQSSIRERIEGKVVMVTGAGGSIGSELCRQIARFRPLALIGFDIAETPLFQIDRELAKSFPDLVFHPEIGNVTRLDVLRRAMKRYRPSILYHAAAYKHVPLMERHFFTAVENNVFGTWHTAQAAIESGVEDFVMISTDKAVRPTSMMGATKRIAELAIRALQQQYNTRFVTVRFGNVLGSNGSVIPIFKEQIAAGGPVTVTDPQMERFFMTIPEASQLVLQASVMGNGGEVFVLDMGQPVKIVDLARNLILLSGLQPGRDIAIEFTGMRPGEKLYEELNQEEEKLVPTSHKLIQSYKSPDDFDGKQMRSYLNDLRQVVDERDVASLLLLLRELIPDHNLGLQAQSGASSPIPSGAHSGIFERHSALSSPMQAVDNSFWARNRVN